MSDLLNYRIRRSQRAKNARIVVTPGKVEVVVPLKFPELRIHHFVDAKRDWILSTLKRLADVGKQLPGLIARRYADGSHVPYLGRQLRLRIEHSSYKTVLVKLQSDSELLVRLPHGHSAGEESIKALLSDWYKIEARKHVQLYVDKHAPRYQLWPRGIRIKMQKSRWGSCGPKNDINLNWLLMLAPAEALEYVVVHELCHIRHKNHSRDFWQLVAEHLPGYQQQRKWLKQHGASVMQGL